MNLIYILIANVWDTDLGMYKQLNVAASTEREALFKKLSSYNLLRARLSFRDDSAFCTFVGRHGRSSSKTIEEFNKLTKEEFEFILHGFDEFTMFEIKDFPNLEI